MNFGLLNGYETFAFLNLVNVNKLSEFSKAKARGFKVAA
jgi:hypothetical protein